MNNHAPLSVSQQGASLCNVAASMERPTFIVNLWRIAIQVPSARSGTFRRGEDVAFSVRRLLSGRGGSSLGHGDDDAGAGLRPATAVAVRDGGVEIDGIFGLQYIFIAAYLEGERPF